MINQLCDEDDKTEEETNDVRAPAEPSADLRSILDDISTDED